MRQSRKLDHIKYSLALTDGPAANAFADFTLIHNALPGLCWQNITLDTTLAGLTLKHPVIINAITGGAADVTAINAKLAEVAASTGAVLAVGSQYAAIEHPEVTASYEIVRKVNPDGIVLANLGAYASVDDAKAAVEMINAQALQLHLNAAQEIMMSEGDRDLTHFLTNIYNIVKAVNVPVIVKEVGCGIACRQAQMLVEAGVRAIDVGGAGGTNFLAIEAARSGHSLPDEMLAWGIPTAISAVEVGSVLPAGVDLIVTGGIRSPLEAVKALALGGKAVGIAAPILKMVQQNSVEYAVTWLTEFLVAMRRYMFLLGAQTPTDLSAVPVIISGYAREWLTARKIDITKYANRAKHG